ncbi:MAG: hypothetical protein MJZ37_08385 [Bacilli bacterium]|nr:hypothetical protein [Bacilli bacterium]
MIVSELNWEDLQTLKIVGDQKTEVTISEVFNYVKYTAFNKKYYTPIEERKGKNKYKTIYSTLPCGFDIETTKYEDHTGIFTKNKGKKVEKINRYSYMYIWQLSIADYVILGRKWDSFEWFINKLIEVIDFEDEDYKLLIFIHNMSFEGSFLLPRYYRDITGGFYTDKRQPIYIEYKNNIRFQDSALISGVSLAKTSEVYNLPTKKLVGDLDYNTPRNSQTQLTDLELQYCINDVLILRDFANYIYNELAPKNFNKIPLTKTQLVLNKIFHSMSYNDKILMGRHKPNYNDYVQSRLWLYRGGYVHANAQHVEEIIDNVDSIDFTSSYPSVMLTQYNVGSRFYDRNIKSMEQFEGYLEKYCVWFRATFYNLRAKTSHTIESSNKCEYISSDAVIDNGRVYSGTITVQLTELDYQNYLYFYEWDDIKIYWCKVAVRKMLPQSIRDVIMEEYEKKAKLKKTSKDSVDYKLSKEFVNSIYGAFCKKVNLDNWTYLNGQWQMQDVGSPEELYNKTMSKLDSLNPMCGVWVTAMARRNLLSMLIKVGDDGLYCDTDSIKLKNASKYYDLIEEYNHNKYLLNKEYCGDREGFDDLGFFDTEDGHYSKFVALRSKAYGYIDKEDNKFHATVSGLRKGIIKSIEDFRDGSYIDIHNANKVTSTYNDEYHSHIITDLQGHSEKMEEYGSCALYNVGFELSLSDDYKSFLKTHYERRKIGV